MTKPKNLGQVFAMAHMPTSNITARSIPRWREANSQQMGGEFEKPDLQKRIQLMSGWARHQWAKGGHPTGDREIAELLTRACGQWELYRRAQRPVVRFAATTWNEGEFDMEFIQSWDHAKPPQVSSD